MNWNMVLSTLISGFVIGFADTASNTGGHVDKHTLITGGVGALLSLANLLRQSPNTPTK
jgi:hypothetical protein